ncbi:Ribosomal RNA large subunit methyltransferase E [Candidatus Methanoperedenaceae archaeon GB50]|nr:Ribosomal RNA large subunit methyltransferase E [Candidatus Methanoperedenaceae archaeon GB50]CAD7779547.1 MAG: Ribosomal RNA large subunit methyltransferase E [Candidatus Methanoperedenaceae archaeon GB50]
MMKHRRDRYYWRAKEEGYRSRAAYKLKQLNERYNVIKRGDVVVDLGAAPGGWLQVAKELSGGLVVGVDLVDIQPIEGVLTLRGDIRHADVLDKLFRVTGGADVVLSDAAPNLSGSWSYDHARSIDLATAALHFAEDLLESGGNFVAKVFQGDLFDEFYQRVKRGFATTRIYSPPASRKESAEVYIIGIGRLSAPFHLGDSFDVVIEDVGRSGDGIVRIDGFVVFVGGVEKGEHVKIEITDIKPRFAFAKVIG